MGFTNEASTWTTMRVGLLGKPGIRGGLVVLSKGQVVAFKYLKAKKVAL